MTIRAIVVQSLFACFLVAAAGTAAAPAAFAQHVVTDDEAGKLTLDALTATPRVIVHRVAYHPVRSVWAGGWTRSRPMPMVHEVSYRRSIRATNTTSHYGVSSHHRRRS